MKQETLVRTIYVYGFSLLGLVLVVIGSVRLLDLGLKIFVFKQADTFVSYPMTVAPGQKEASFSAEVQAEQQRVSFENTKNQRQTAASSSLAMILIGLPVYWYHWRMVSKARN